MKDKFIIALVGIVCITAIVVTCVAKGIDGVVIASGCGLIGTLVGYCFGQKEEKK